MENEIILLDIGGKLFKTYRDTLTSVKGSMLSSMFSGQYKNKQQNDGSYFIDRDPKTFEIILSFYRTHMLPPINSFKFTDAEKLMFIEDLKYWNILNEDDLAEYVNQTKPIKSICLKDEIIGTKDSIQLEQHEKIFDLIIANFTESENFNVIKSGKHKEFTWQIYFGSQQYLSQKYSNVSLFDLFIDSDEKTIFNYNSVTLPKFATYMHYTHKINVQCKLHVTSIDSGPHWPPSIRGADLISYVPKQSQEYYISEVFDPSRIGGKTVGFERNVYCYLNMVFTL